MWDVREQSSTKLGLEYSPGLGMRLTWRKRPRQANILHGNTRKDKYRGGRTMLSTSVEDLSLMVLERVKFWFI
jgi:hypothetical protein